MGDCSSNVIFIRILYFGIVFREKSSLNPYVKTDNAVWLFDVV